MPRRAAKLQSLYTTSMCTVSTSHTHSHLDRYLGPRVTEIKSYVNTWRRHRGKQSFHNVPSGFQGCFLFPMSQTIFRLLKTNGSQIWANNISHKLKCDEAGKIILIMCKHLPTSSIMDWNVFEIAQDMSKHCSWHSKSKNDMILTKKFTRGLRVRYEVRIIWIPYNFIEVLSMRSHSYYSCRDATLYNSPLLRCEEPGISSPARTEKLFGCTKISFRLQFIFTSYFFFPLKSFSWICFSIFWRVRYCQLSGRCFRQT